MKKYILVFMIFSLFIIIFSGCLQNVSKLTTIEVVPLEITMHPDDTQIFTAVGKDQFNKVMECNFSWSLNNDFGSLSSTSGKSITFTAEKSGETILTVSSNEISKSAKITIEPPEVDDNIVFFTIEPFEASIAVSQSIPIHAQAFDENDDPVNVDFNWTVEGGIGVVEPTVGQIVKFTATSAGNGKVLGTYKNVTMEVDITVVIETPVQILDPGLETAVREELALADGEIYPINLKEIHGLSADELNIENLDGIQYCTNLEYLSLSDNYISDISLLSNLTKLKSLYLDGNYIEDISSLSNLTNLDSVDLEYNQITDIASLSNLINITYLGISDNLIQDISAISNMTKLERLDADNINVSDLTPLANLIHLTDLYLRENQISDLTPLQNLTNLELLWLRDNPISSLEPLRNLVNMQDLNLRYISGLSDIDPLQDMTNLIVLYLDGNQISNISALSNMNFLKELQLDQNQITDITSIANLQYLEELYLAYNSISDISPLKECTYLERVDLTDNQIADITPLLDNPGLGLNDFLDLESNPLNPDSIEAINLLKERGVEIEY